MGDFQELDQILQPTFQIFNQPCTKMDWPSNAGMFVTRLPTTEKEGYSKGYTGYIANRAFNSLNNNSLAYVIVSSFKEDKLRPFEIASTFMAAGFKFIDYIIWVKNKFIPTQGNKRLNNLFDFILMFSKGDNYHLDRASVASLRHRLDSSARASKSRVDFLLEEGVDPMEALAEDTEYQCAGNVWKIKIDDVEFIPVELIENLIKLSNILPNTLIIDPIMGNGSTLKAALRYRHSFWGCETDKLKYDVCKKTIKDIIGIY